MGFLSDLHNDDPDLDERMADGFQSILYLGDPENFATKTPTMMDLRDRSERGSQFERGAGPARY